MFCLKHSKIRALFLTVCLVTSFWAVNAQNQRAIDSLRSVYPDLNEKELVDSLVQFAWDMRFDDPVKLYTITQEAKELAEAIDYQEGYASIYNNFGQYHLTYDEYEEAKSFYDQAYELSEKFQDTALLSSLSNNLGITNQRLGQWDQALKHYLKAILFAKNYKDSSSLATYYDNVAVIYFLLNKKETAIDYFERALDIRERRNDSLLLSNSFNNLAIYYKQTGEQEKALRYLRKAAHVFRKKDKYSLSTCYANIANVHNDLGQFDSATHYFQMAMVNARELGQKKQVVEVLVNSGNLYQGLDNIPQAIKQVRKGLELAREIKYLEGAKEAALKLSKIYEKQKKFNEALLYYRLYTNYQDSITNDAKEKNILRLEEEFNTQKRIKEIKMLAQKNELLQKNQKIENLEHERAEAEKNNWIYGLSGGGFLLVVLAIALFNRIRYKQKTNNQLEKKNKEINLQKDIIEEKNKDITDSIKYAEGIQKALLSSAEPFFTQHQESFVFYLPRDIVSGDFYWHHKSNNTSYIAAADCTGHGVPGAFVSMMCHNLLSHAVIEKKLAAPGEVLREVNKGVAERLGGGTDGEHYANDGMDVALCAINYDNKGNAEKVRFAAAMNPLLIIREEEIIEIKGDRVSVGGKTPKNHLFQTHEIDLNVGDMLYIYTDGFQDQFGGPKGKKYMVGKFKKKLKEISGLPAAQQRKRLQEELDSWQSSATPYEQVDDICIIGIRV